MGNASAYATEKKPVANNEIIHRTLGKTGIQLPVVNLGRVLNEKMITMALEGGMTLIDTGYIYWDGKHEEMLGELLKDRPRDSFYLATKVDHRREPLTVDSFIKQFETSLHRLKLDYVDILHLHGASSREDTLNDTYLTALTKMRKQGKARFLGLSTHSNQPEVIRAAIESKIYDVVLTSYNFRLDNLRDNTDAIAEANHAGLGIIAMKTMAGAYWDKEGKDPINTKAALKFVLQNENIHTTIPGVRAFHELEDNFEVNKDISMTTEEIQDLRLEQAKSGLFCFGCDNCKTQCSNNMPISDIMRSYMYAYGYKDLSQARSTLDSLNLPDNICSRCDSCSVKCVQGFDVAEKIKDIDRLRNVPSDFIT